MPWPTCTSRWITRRWPRTSCWAESSAARVRSLVGTMAVAGIAAGADGLIVEVHPDPANAKCDGQQTIDPAALATIARRVSAVHAALAYEDQIVPAELGLTI